MARSELALTLSQCKGFNFGFGVSSLLSKPSFCTTIGLEGATRTGGPPELVSETDFTAIGASQKRRGGIGGGGGGSFLSTTLDGDSLFCPEKLEPLSGESRSEDDEDNLVDEGEVEDGFFILTV